MNKIPVYFLLLITVCLAGCDTKDNVPVRNENFFIKLYAGKTAGNQVGTDIIETSDGGFLLVGTSSTDNHDELLLIKTDSKGNEEWTYGADTTLNLQSSIGKSVIELPDGYVVGGTVVGENSRSILLKIGFDGLFSGVSSAIITEDIGGTEYDNTLSKITVGASGILVSGETRRPASGGAGGINGFFGLYDPVNFTPIRRGSEDIVFFGGDGDDRVTGAYEILDTVNNIGGNQSEFLLFGSTNDDVSLPSSLYYIGIQHDFSIVPSFGTSDGGVRSGDQTANYLTRSNDKYVQIGGSETNSLNIFLMGWEFSPGNTGNSDWKPTVGSGEISSSDEIIGKGAAIQNSNKIIIVGDEIITQDENTLIYLAGVNSNFSIESPWPRKFGTNTSTYSASAVTVLQDGSIVMVGTADLEPIKKILVIKTGPDGQMSF